MQSEVAEDLSQDSLDMAAVPVEASPPQLVQTVAEQWPSPEDFLPAQRRMPSAFQRWPQRNFAKPAIALGIICLLVSLLGWSDWGQHFSVSGQEIYAGQEYWRLASALFAHADLGHLGSNLMPFLFFGWMLHSYFGWLAFPVVPLLVGVVSNFATVSIYSPAVNLLGASGMVYGMFALWLFLYLKFERNIPLSKKLVRAVGFSLILLLPTSYEQGTSYLAHASGFSAGLVASVMTSPFYQLRDPSVVLPRQV